VEVVHKRFLGSHLAIGADLTCTCPSGDILSHSIRHHLHAMIPGVFVALALLKPDRIASADRASPHDSGVNTDVDLVVLGRSAQDSRDPW